MLLVQAWSEHIMAAARLQLVFCCFLVQRLLVHMCICKNTSKIASYIDY